MMSRCAACFAYLFLLLPLLASAQPVLESAQPPPAKPAVVQIGIYVLRLSDFNPASQSFSADFWVWTLSDVSPTSHPIDSLRVQNAKQVTGNASKEVLVDGGRRVWGYREFNATLSRISTWSVFHSTGTRSTLPWGRRNTTRAFWFTRPTRKTQASRRRFN